MDVLIFATYPIYDLTNNLDKLVRRVDVGEAWALILTTGALDGRSSQARYGKDRRLQNSELPVLLTSGWVATESISEREIPSPSHYSTRRSVYQISPLKTSPKSNSRAAAESRQL